MADLAPLFTWRSAICESGLSSTTKHVAVTLSLYMNERGGSAHPGAARLARDTSLHKTTVLKALRQLETEGWLICTLRGSAEPGGARKASEYVANNPAPAALNDRSQKPTGRSRRADRSFSQRRPVAQDDPISSGTLHRTRVVGVLSCEQCHHAMIDIDGRVYCPACQEAEIIPLEAVP